MGKREKPDMASAIMKAVLNQDVEDGIEFDGSEMLPMASPKMSKSGYFSDQEKQKASRRGAFEVRDEMQGVLIAQALDQLGFFNSVDPTEEYRFGGLSDYIAEDVNFAFKT